MCHRYGCPAHCARTKESSPRTTLRSHAHSLRSNASWSTNGTTASVRRPRTSGADSFVRAQWAGQPYLWHIYPQDADAHLTKMDAFLTRIESSLPEPARAAQRTFWYAWN